MLEQLRLRGLGVIADAEVELGSGFTVLTGETGAGKTMVLTGLALLLGGRPDAALVRAGHARAEVDGILRLPPGSKAAERARDAGAALDEDLLVLARTVSAEGRSRAYAGGRAVPAQLLAELGEELVAVHGQSDQRGLLRPGVQRDLLDRYGGVPLAAATAAYQAAYRRATELRAALVEVSTRGRERAQEADLLRHGLAEIEAAAPAPGEDVTLQRELRRLEHVDALQRAVGAARVELAGVDDAGSDRAALARLATARRALETVEGHDSELDALARRLTELTYLLADVAADLGTYAERLDADPGRLGAIQQRKAALAALTRKYAPDVDGVLAWAVSARERLAELGDDEGRVHELSAALDGAVEELTGAAQALSRERQQAAGRLAGSATAELAALAMPHASLDIKVSQRPDRHGLALPDGTRVAFGPAGIDEVEVVLVPHAGAAGRPLHRGASGGELSRVMLALEVTLAGADPVPTFVFDEVDAGIGGQTAVEVGRRLAQLATTAQVVVVTHLPQVAAFADQHLVVRKDAAGNVTRADVVAVEGTERVRELTRMLAGLPESAAGREHAEELLDLAAESKNGS